MTQVRGQTECPLNQLSHGNGPGKMNQLIKVVAQSGDV